MSRAPEENQADEARSAMASDIREIKAAGGQAITKAKSQLPWVIGGALGLTLIGVVLSGSKPRRRSLFEAPRRSFFGAVVRAAALSATSLLAKRYAERAVNRILPETAEKTRQS